MKHCTVAESGSTPPGRPCCRSRTAGRHPGPCFCSKRVAFAAEESQQSTSSVVLAFARLRHSLSRTAQCLDSLQQPSLLQLNVATAAGSSALDQPAFQPLQPIWSWCLCSCFCWTLPARPGMLTGPHLCTPWSLQCSPTATMRASAVGRYLGTKGPSPPWRLSCTCRGWGTIGSGRPEASGAPATKSTFFESKRATWALCV